MTVLLDRPAIGGLTPFSSIPENLAPYGADYTDTDIQHTENPLGGGYATEGDIVYVTNDGTDLNALWAEAQQTLAVWNAHRSKLVDLFTFQVLNEIESVPQVGEATFEEATEFGEPQGERLKLAYFQLGFDFKDYDRATRFTWKALRDMDARQVRAVHNALLQADDRLVFKQVMAAIFDNRNRETDIRGNAYKVYPLYNADGTEPPEFRGTTFDGEHNHYMCSGNELLDSGDIEEAYDNIAEHGYSLENGTVIICFMNRKYLREVRKWRTDKENNNGVKANYDFIPAPSQPTQIIDTPLGLLGGLPPDTWKGLRVYGSYADILFIEEPFIPDDYFLMIGTGGVGNLQNLVGLREHKNAVYRGLRIIPGRDQRYPLIESYYARAFGTGIRQRAGGVVMQIGEVDEYEIPRPFNRDLWAVG